MTMKRDECLKVLARHLNEDAIVVPVYSTACDWIAIRPSALNYTAHGAMGLASSHGLGLALGRPDRKVIILDGDGSLLMNLGSLVTISAAAPPNFIHLVFENGSYEANGGHPIPNQGAVSFAGLAEAAGYRKTYEFSTLDEFEAGIGKVLAEQGPVLADLKIVRGAELPQDYGALLGASGRAAFRQGLADLKKEQA
ncbi:MAG: thiamine pyrophosphate-dependent enzyme [Rhodospirillales bacterium]|mgnify:CR=1 FL=1|jgi:phosphonopyruvate decarboxylase|nr:thiamine pyrophosphate-dependent enzyme [Rhodospirillales bacterium]|tara:strand:+ start:1426 stop:2013 length:588 start_codon:yes stop_codon:yes gene_type:complete